MTLLINVLFNVALGLAAAYAIYLGSSYRRLRRVVWSNLDSAFDEGQFLPDGWCYGMTSKEIATDMTLHAADCECYTAEQIYPHVKAWARAKT